MPEFLMLRANVVAALDAFDRLIGGDAASAAGQLANTRMRLVQAVNAYITCLGAHFQTTPDPSWSAPWRVPFDEVTALRKRYSNHIGLWSSNAVAGNWAEYVATSGKLVTEMRRHLATTAGLPLPS